MNKILFLILNLILSACSPQVTVTSQVTVTLAPPTSTPIPTPTLHPDFVALQNLISDSSNLVLLPDGTIEHNGLVIPNLHVDQNGVINIIFNNEHVGIEISQISFDDESGLTIEGYELDENGKWVEAVSEARQMATELAEQYNLVDTERYTITDDGSTASVIDNETGKVLIKSNGISTWYGIEFAADTIAANSCESTPFIPKQNGRMSGEYGTAWAEYMTALKNELNYRSGDLGGYPVLLAREKQCWGFANIQVLLYRDKDGVAQKLPLIAFTEEEKAAFLESRADK